MYSFVLLFEKFKNGLKIGVLVREVKRMAGIFHVFLCNDDNRPEIIVKIYIIIPKRRQNSYRME